MRNEEYILEKNTYKDVNYISKRDKVHKKKYPSQYRFHKFVKLRVFSREKENIFICNNYIIRLQNMDRYFYFDNNRRNRMYTMLERFCV